MVILVLQIKQVYETYSTYLFENIHNLVLILLDSSIEYVLLVPIFILWHVLHLYSCLLSNKWGQEPNINNYNNAFTERIIINFAYFYKIKLNNPSFLNYLTSSRVFSNFYNFKLKCPTTNLVSFTLLSFFIDYRNST